MGIENVKVLVLLPDGEEDDSLWESVLERFIHILITEQLTPIKPPQFGQIVGTLDAGWGAEVNREGSVYLYEGQARRG